MGKGSDHTTRVSVNRGEDNLEDILRNVENVRHQAWVVRLVGADRTSGKAISRVANVSGKILQRRGSQLEALVLLGIGDGLGLLQIDV